MKTKWSKISLIFLLIVALIGTLLRASPFLQIPLKHSNLVHAHSHVAFQGWIYTIMFLTLTKIYLDGSQFIKGQYLLQFKLTILVIIGILISFSMEGYGLSSIIFSTFFQLLNFWFIYQFFKDLKSSTKNDISIRFVKTGLWLGLLSTIMPFGIGILSSKGLKGTEIYNSFIYSFMHLQYNGWFLFVALGLFYKLLKNNNILFNKNRALKFYWLFTVSIIPAIALSLLGMTFSKHLIIPGSLAAILQSIGLLFFILSISKSINNLKQKNKWLAYYLSVFLLSFFLKVTLQSISVFPAFHQQAFNNKFILLAYLHLSLIGVISFLFLAVLIEIKWLTISHLSKTASIFLFFGFISTELLLLLGGLEVYHSHLTLMIGSISMVLGILLIIISRNKELTTYGKF